MGSHSVTCHPTQVSAPRLNSSHAGWYSIYLPERDQTLSWPCYLVAQPPRVELTTSRSRIQRPNHWATKQSCCCCCCYWVMCRCMLCIADVSHVTVCITSTAKHQVSSYLLTSLLVTYCCTHITSRIIIIRAVSVSTVTHEPPHSAWWYFARTCILTTAWTLLNFKVKGEGHTSFLVFFCMHSAAATCGQYLSLSKAWLSCY